jgi:hypothetical protein
MAYYLVNNLIKDLFSCIDCKQDSSVKFAGEIDICVWPGLKRLHLLSPIVTSRMLFKKEH